MKFQRWTWEQAISVHCADSSRKDVPKKKKKTETEWKKSPEVLTNAFECTERFIHLADNLTMITNVCVNRIPSK